MLNLSENRIDHLVEKEKYTSFSSVIRLNSAKIIARLMLGILVFSILFLFLPWTQNIQSRGLVTTLYPSERPNTLQSVIPGAIQKWYVREGDFVKKGDTILVLSEIKDEYFDPLLVERVQSQIDAKTRSQGAYSDKVNALNQQLFALDQGLRVKLQQADMKVQQASFKLQADSAQYIAQQAEYEVAEYQFRRMDTLYQRGLKSLTDLESRRIRLQESTARLQTVQNRILSSIADLGVAKAELNALQQEYAEKSSKSLSERSGAESALFESVAEIAKMQNTLSNYSIRQGYYYITAPQDGYITQTIKAGIGEMVSTGEQLLSIMPAKITMATEVYVRPMDVSLLSQGVKVRLQFDGWPAVVFSGWPGTSFGTYGGIVAAIDNFPSENGLFRILVKPDPNDEPWPELVRVGGGTRAIILLNNVPIWYELWRQINGFPPDFYVMPNDAPQKASTSKNDKKK
jgi:membrane fusion protein, adhesin transport system